MYILTVTKPDKLGHTEVVFKSELDFFSDAMDLFDYLAEVYDRALYTIGMVGPNDKYERIGPFELDDGKEGINVC